jgi:hypothetical protein
MCSIIDLILLTVFDSDFDSALKKNLGQSRWQRRAKIEAFAVVLCRPLNIETSFLD